MRLVKGVKGYRAVGDINFTGERLTYDEIGKRLGMCKNGVRAVEIRALRKIRAALAKQGITNFSDLFGDDIAGVKRNVAIPE